MVKFDYNFNCLITLVIFSPVGSSCENIVDPKLLFPSSMSLHTTHLYGSVPNETEVETSSMELCTRADPKFYYYQS